MLKVLKCTQIHLNVRNYAVFKQMKYLNVAEKHDAAKTIAGLLSNGTARRREGYSVYNKIFDFDTVVKDKQCKMVMTSVSGHLLHLEFLASYRNWRNIDPQALFDAPIRKACPEDYQPIKRTLEREIRGCQGLILWTDCDREGENIGFEIVEVCRAVKPNIKVYRAVFSEITTRAVRRALQQLKEPDKRQSDAVDVRTELDLRTGAAITRYQTLRLQRLFPEKIADKLISYGSCQIPTLGFVADRYKEIEAFVSEAFWKLKVTHTIDDLTVDFHWARNRLFDKQACEDFLVLCLADPKATVESVTVKPKSKWRPTPLDTVEMEKLGSRKLKLSAKETMSIAEKLYTKGIISYPRTETNQFSNEFDLSSLVAQQTGHAVWGSFAQRVIEWGPNPRNGNKSDQAHPPIHPTKLVTDLQGNDARVYELVCRHFLACVSKDAIGSETVVHIDIAGEKFSATGLVIYERNYLDVYIYDKWNAKQIHNYTQGQVFDPTEISMQEGCTTAPPLLTEADLIALMEKHGIGTDATHAEHINTIKERGYIGVVDGGGLVPGVIGMGLYEGYAAMELALAKPVLRAEFEADLKKICLGQKDPKTVLREQIQKYKEAYRQITEKITAMDEKVSFRINETPAARPDGAANGGSSDFENNPNRLQELLDCPKCEIAPLALKQKKNQSGHFIGCLNFPECKNVVWLPEECKEPTVLAETCRNCGSTVKMLKFKFHTALYKSMFNAPYGWYKTCLRCDALFRETFNINLENVKRVGGIVSDARTTTTATARATGSSSSSISGNVPMGGNNSTASTSTSNTNPPKNTRIKKPKASSTETRPKVVQKISTTTEQRGNTNIRSYFTAASVSRDVETQSAEQLAAAELGSIQLDEFFDSNDSFEDIMLEAEALAAASIATTTTTTTTARFYPKNNLVATAASTSNIRFNNNSNNTRTTAVFNDSIVNAFAADNDGDLANFSWGTGNRRSTLSLPQKTANTQRQVGNGTTVIRPATTTRPATITNTPTTPTNVRTTTTTTSPYANPLDADTSYISAMLLENNDDFEDFAWGTAAHRSRNSTTSTSKRPRLDAPAEQQQQQNSFDESRNNSFTEHGGGWGTTHGGNSRGVGWDSSPATGWGSSNARGWSGAVEVAQAVKCTGCHQLAKELTVKKDGPNKGRQFYACAKSNPCKFFQWADEPPEAQRAHSQTGRNSGARAALYSPDRPSTSAAAAGSGVGGWGTAGLRDGDGENVNCNCGNSANSLTVRKDGPNKGRPFYACANRDQSCGFFKWGDEDDNRASTFGRNQNHSSWGSGSQGSSSSENRGAVVNGRANTQRDNKKRKCGLCRLEGHTKLKCPRKAEFEY